MFCAWNTEKNEKLIVEHDICFEEIELALHQDINPIKVLRNNHHKDWQALNSTELNSMVSLIKGSASSKQISLRVFASDIAKCEARAKSQGFKYQSVIKALIHQYAMGKIKIVLSDQSRKK